ncbi:two-component sensor histidine kinase [Maribacter vaceletii]|uniref:histidine kinase n=1 Tax=Maribacter vaceletii TaxID=1206816 RepID=A0A495E6C2_9FLAO|nr:sensor histidine kinase [Maribacter vaceletii]RKR12241.1 two-component sensor histidine kinase [Maribacter vaceletii]
MHNNILDNKKQIKKTNLFLIVNYVSSLAAILFAGVCYFVFKINLLVAIAFLIFGILIFINSFLIKKNIALSNSSFIYSNNTLSKKLLEKETLLKEIHHRVKNNLQTVSSLLSMQSRNMEDKELQTLLKGTQNRVISMSMIHEMLYMRNDLSKIEYKTYVQELSQYLIKSIKGIENKVKLTIDIPDIKLGIDTAIPLGLLINETITNALKYGIVDDSEGEIHIAIKKEVNKEYVLTIGDNGVGFPETVNHKNTKSLGLKLIYSLTRQLKGSVIRDISKKGTNYIIKFQEIGHQLNPVV